MQWNTFPPCFSKPLNYGIALEKLGQDIVHQYVGQEPSGCNFNELVLDHNSKSDFNTMTHVSFLLFFNFTWVD